MIDDPKLEKLVGSLRQAARYKAGAEKECDDAKAQLPRLESTAGDASTKYEAALHELAEYVKSQ